jgi:hypothetical protein
MGLMSDEFTISLVSKTASDGPLFRTTLTFTRELASSVASALGAAGESR